MLSNLPDMLTDLDRSRTSDYMCGSHPSNYITYKSMPTRTIVPLYLYAEARMAGRLGMLLVGMTARNRVNRLYSPRLEDWKKVLLAKKQFRCFDPEDAHYHRIDTPLDYHMWQEANKAAYDVMTEGRIPDLTDGAVFYYVRHPSEPDWCPSWSVDLTRTVAYRGFVFLRDT